MQTVWVRFWGAHWDPKDVLWYSSELSRFWSSQYWLVCLPGIPLRVSLFFLYRSLSDAFRIRTNKKALPLKSTTNFTSLAWLVFLAWSARRQQIINHKTRRSVEAICTRAAESDEGKKKREVKHVGKWSIVFQKFETHDKIVSIQILSTTPNKLWVFQLKVRNEWSTLKKKPKKHEGQKSAQGYPRYTHFCYIFSQIWCKMTWLRRYQIAKRWHGWSMLCLSKLQMDSDKTGKF